ncbi:hypothetical protein J4460_07675 [Candidatus Woesearchaeota archaeon]|nr:hypothetical protein [Candidatus Woesearchaeota archaeon]HIH37997.1 hypothetical protein [Candidatus Woesearchaeota archaeon]HIH48666.1 hypothetical protein [Candidatus Woesearchaeota archaeon]HIJ02966.1 hypothetical protein [Candidatus Woesearchaeota archaeon]
MRHLHGKRGQAAMEFLTTYGWALLVAIVVIGALAYFGVLSPGKFVPDSCQLAGQVSCVAMNIGENGQTLKFSIQNNVGKVIDLVSVEAKGDFESDSKNIVCTNDATVTPTDNIRPGATGEVGLDCSGSTVQGISRGDVVDLVVTITYRIQATGFEASASGPVHFRAP